MYLYINGIEKRSMQGDGLGCVGSLTFENQCYVILDLQALSFEYSYCMTFHKSEEGEMSLSNYGRGREPGDWGYVTYR